VGGYVPNLRSGPHRRGRRRGEWCKWKRERERDEMVVVQDEEVMSWQCSHIQVSMYDALAIIDKSHLPF